MYESWSSWYLMQLLAKERQAEARLLTRNAKLAKEMEKASGQTQGLIPRLAAAWNRRASLKRAAKSAFSRRALR